MIQIKKGDYTKSQLKEYAASQYELAHHCFYEIRNLEQKYFDAISADNWDSADAVAQRLTTMKNKKRNFETNVEELRKLHDDEVDSICFLEERDAHTPTTTTNTTTNEEQTMTTNTKLQKANFYIDPQTKFQGWHNPLKKWNGWSTPSFTHEVVQDIVQHLTNNDAPLSCSEDFVKLDIKTPTGEDLYCSRDSWCWTADIPKTKTL